MSDTVRVNFSDVGERIWMLEAMGAAISSKSLFMACEEVAPIISPSQDMIKNAGLVMNEQGQPIWNKSMDTSLDIDVPTVIINGLRESVFGPIVVNDRTLTMIEKLELWTVH